MIEYATDFQPAVDELFASESKTALVTNQNFTWTGAHVVKIASNRLPEGFGFMIAHPCATVAPTKLEQYNVHRNPPFISGSLVEGRITYDAFILANKAKAIYYQAIA